MDSEHASCLGAWVQITPEIYWLESDFVKNVIVTNNIFDSFYGGITLGIILDGTFQPGQFQNHYNVTISGNIIRVRLMLFSSHLKIVIIPHRYHPGLVPDGIWKAHKCRVLMT